MKTSPHSATTYRLSSSALALALLLPSAASAQDTIQPAPPLLVDAPPIADAMQALDPTIKVSRAVTVDLAVLDTAARQRGVVQVKLDDQHVYRARFDRVEPAQFGGTNYFGHFERRPGSSFIIATIGGQVAATFQPLDTALMYLLTPGTGGLFMRGHESDVSRCGTDHALPTTRQTMARRLRSPTTGATPGRPSPSAGGGSGNGNGTDNPTCCYESPNTITVQFVYTPLAAFQAGLVVPSVLAQLATAQTNQDLLSTADAGFSLQVIQAGPVAIWNHTEPCDPLNLSLAALSSDATIANLRDAREADLVAALIGDTGSNCHGNVVGRANIGTGTNAAQAFSVNNINSAATVVPHELGHNFGCNHQTTCSTATSYNHAWAWTCNFTSVQRSRMWATLGSSVVARFSSPLGGTVVCGPTGNAGCADNIRVINEHRQGIANYRGGAIATSSAYGAGWPGSFGVPTLTAASPPVVGGTLQTFISNTTGLASPPGAIVVGDQPLSAATPWGGTALVAPVFTIPVSVNGGTHPIAIPGQPYLCGLTLYFQAVVLDFGASHDIAFSNGLRADLGR